MAAEPLWINANAGAPSYTANELRQAMALPLQYDGRLVGGRAGVRPGGDQLKVSLSVSTITVQPGLAVVDPALSTPQGPYWVAIGTAETHTLTAADASNPRKDIVVLRVYDHDEDASGQRMARTEYIAGTAGPSPSEPAVPAGALKLALIDVPASPGAAVVTDRRVDCFAGPEMVVFTSSGTFSKASYPWARRARVRCQAGGGGGGGAAATSTGEASEGGGAGAGGYAETWLNVRSLASSVTVTVGAGGTGTAGAGGGTGGDSSFGTACSAVGGGGGNLGSATSGTTLANGGSGGAGTGDLAQTGGDGGNGRIIGGAPLFVCYGGASGLGSSVRASVSASTVGAIGKSYGGGGTGGRNAASQASKAGGVGGPGVVIVELY